MNWTGGRLQRHSKNAGGGVASRQKQHFAKVRTLLQNGVHPGHLPFRPSFVQDDDTSLGGRLPPFTERTSRHVGRSRKHQRRTHPELASDDNEPDGAELIASPAVSLVVNAIDGDSTGKGKAKMKRQSLHPLFEDDLLESNRKRLLARRDWLGLESSRPVRMKFRTRTEKEKIGKRRKIISTLSRGHATEDSKAISLPGQGHTEERSRLDLAPARDALGDHLRVRIGTDAFVSQRSSTQIRDPPHRASSDTMLFDITQEADTASAVEAPREPSNEQYSFPEMSYNAEHGTALKFDGHPTATVSVDSHSSTRGENETRPSAKSIEELGVQQEAIERDSSEPDCMDEKLATHLPDVPATNGHLIFQSTPPASSESDQPTSHTAMHVNSRRSNIIALDNVEDRLSQRSGGVDQDPKERQIADEMPWKQWFGISDDGQSHSSTSAASEKGCLHESKAPTRGHHESSADITASEAAPIGNHPNANTWVIARQIDGKTTQEYTTFGGHVRAPLADENDNDNHLWQDFVFGSRSSSGSDGPHGISLRTPVHSARGTSMKALYSSIDQAKSTGSISASKLTAPRLRNMHAGWSQTDETRLRPAGLALSSLYNNTSRSITSPVTAAYSNIGLTNYANSDVSMAVSGPVYEVTKMN